jgi:hypothetical protein
MDLKKMSMHLTYVPTSQVLFSKEVWVNKETYLYHGRLTQAAQHNLPIEYTTLVCRSSKPENYSLSFHLDGGSPFILKGAQILRNDFAQPFHIK